MAVDERVILVPEDISVHAPADSDPDWLKRNCVAVISTTSWPDEDMTEPAIHALNLSRDEAQHVVNELTKLLKAS